MFSIKSSIPFFLLFFSISCSQKLNTDLSPEIIAKVIAVKDGDTIEILYNEKPLRIRLSHIDCPEVRGGQPFGKNAKQLTSKLCFGQEVKIINEGKYDRYGRLLALIINNNNQNINQELVKAGYAWHYKQFSMDTVYANLEAEARRSKVGIWSEENPVAPWAWRKPARRPAKDSSDKTIAE